MGQIRMELVQQVMSHDVAYFISEIAKRDVTIVELRGKISSLEQELLSLKKLVFGKKSEKMPSPGAMLNGNRGKSDNRANQKQKIKDRRKKLSERRLSMKLKHPSVNVLIVIAQS